MICMDKKRRIELRGLAQKLEATVHVGKEGASLMVVEEIVRQLDKHKLVKVRVLQSIERSREEIANELAKASASFLVEIRGRTIVLARD
jgi:RNA-binding protein